MHSSTFTDKPATLAEVLARVETAAALDACQRRDQRSAVTCFCRLVHRAPRDVVVDVPALREELNGLHHVQANIAKSTISNLRTNFRLALQNSGALPARELQQPLSDPWQSFLALIRKSLRTAVQNSATVAAG